MTNCLARCFDRARLMISHQSEDDPLQLRCRVASVQRGEVNIEHVVGFDISKPRPP